MNILCTFDEGTDLVLYYKRLMVLEGNENYQYQIYSDDQLSLSQQAHIDSQFTLFKSWWNSWEGKDA
jgi:4-hydroxy-tetrahydrodipicolinate synthase